VRRKKGGVRVLGIDLSLRATGLVVLADDWGQDWSRCVHQTLGYGLAKDAPEDTRIARLHSMAVAIALFAMQHRPSHIAIEQYAFSRMASQAHALGELGGAVKAALWRAGFPVRPVVAMSARKVVMGVCPRNDAKRVTHLALYRMGAPKSWTGDELDAWVVANALLAEVGTGALVQAAR